MGECGGWEERVEVREEESGIYIGLLNLSKSALTSGIEWNYRFSNRMDPGNFGMFYAAFEEFLIIIRL